MLPPITFEYKNKQYSIEIINKKQKSPLPGSQNDKRSMLVKKKQKTPKLNLSTASNISLHSSFDNAEFEIYKYQFLYLYNLCILRKNYNNFVALVHPELFELQKKNHYFNIDSYDEFVGSRPFGIYFGEDKFYYLGQEDPSNFIKLLHVLEKREERFIFIYAPGINTGTDLGHANMIILDTIYKKGYYFEPHGIQIYFLNQAKQNELGKLFKDEGYEFYFPNEYYYKPLYMETNGFQNMDERDSTMYGSAKPGKLDAAGYCFYWCMYFINMIIKHPHIPIDNLFKQLFIGLGKFKKQDFRRHIRTYAQRQEKAIKEIYPDCATETIQNKKCKEDMFLEYYKVFNYKYDF